MHSRDARTVTVIFAVLPDEMHFLELGEVVDADKDDSVWLPENLGRDRARLN